MKLRVVFVLGSLLAVASGSALAFQEQQQGAAPAPAPGEAAPAAPANGAAAPASNLEFPKAQENQASDGTEVRIPGLGRLGVLPKMDFGLDLLYGANEQSKPAETERELPADSDLTIRGSLKHNF